MIRCISCQNEELIGALYCGKCGAQIIYQEKVPTRGILYTRETGPLSGSIYGAGLEAAPPVTFEIPPGVAVKLVEINKTFPLEGSSEYTIGRVSGNQPILPDIDLTSYQAYEQGVSRLHASVRVTPEAITLTDLGSANGTFLNGKKIAAHDPQPLIHGDLFSLGKFKLQISIQK